MLTSADFLQALRDRGATRVRRVQFRDNRNTLWSLTKRGTVLNVHVAFSRADETILDAFAALAKEGGVRSAKARRAADQVSSWPHVTEAINEARERHMARNQATLDGSLSHCSATPGQRFYIRALYRYFNHTRFDGRLPDGIPIRLSGRMRSSLGHMQPGERADGTRYVMEIALNIDLMLPGNGAERADTLLHEMAHVADYLETGGRGHGESWREWANRVGCRPTTLYDRPVRYRSRRRSSVTRVPPLPPSLIDFTTAGSSQAPRTDQAGQSHPNAPAVNKA